jgi:hypothetical protein
MTVIQLRELWLKVKPKPALRYSAPIHYLCVMGSIQHSVQDPDATYKSNANIERYPLQK